jgi:hypothetical protein
MRHVICLLFLIITGRACIYPDPQLKSRVTSRCEGFYTMENRIVLDIGTIRGVAVDVREGEENPRRVFGIKTPQIVIGPLSIKGLIKEIERPLSYSPTAAVYRQNTGMALDGSIAGGARRGVYVSILSRANGYYFSKGDELLHWGGWIDLVPQRLVVLADYSRVGQADVKEYQPPVKWFPDYIQPPGEEILRVACRSVFSKQNLRLNLEWGLCRSNYRTGGGFISVPLELSAPLIRAGFLLGYASPGYLTEGGLPIDQRVRAGAIFDYGSYRTGRKKGDRGISGEYSFVLGRSPVPGPGSFPQIHDFALETEFNLNSRTAWIGFGGDYKRTVSAGLPQNELEFFMALFTGIRDPRSGSFHLEWAGEIIPEGQMFRRGECSQMENSFVVEGGFRGLSSRLKLCGGDHLQIEGRVRFELPVAEGKLFVSVKTAKPIPLDNKDPGNVLSGEYLLVMFGWDIVTIRAVIWPSGNRE